LFFGVRIVSLDALPARRPMFGEGDPLLLWSHGADMRDDVARIELELDLVPGLANLYPPPDPGDRNRVANRMHGDISSASAHCVRLSHWTC
jgi:hypothetical protein